MFGTDDLGGLVGAHLTFLWPLTPKLITPFNYYLQNIGFSSDPTILDIHHVYGCTIAGQRDAIDSSFGVDPYYQHGS